MSNFKNKLLAACLEYSGKKAVDAHWVWDPNVSDCLVARLFVEKAPGSTTEPWYALFTHVSAHPTTAELVEKWEEVTLETWPPRFGTVRFFT